MSVFLGGMLFRGLEHVRGHDGVRGATQPNVDLQNNQQDTQANKDSADRPLDEDGDIAARNQHGAAKILLEARAEHEAEENRRRVETKSQQHIPENADNDCLADLEHVVVGGIDTDGNKEERAWIKILVWNGKKFHPNSD